MLPHFEIWFEKNEFIHYPPLDIAFYGEIPRSREKGIAEMIRSVVERHSIKEDFYIYVRIADGPLEHDFGHVGTNAPNSDFHCKIPETHYALCVYNQNYKRAFVDFIYVGYPETGLLDYTETINSFEDTLPKTNKIGWCGSCSCGDSTPRPKFLRLAERNPDFLEGRHVFLNTGTTNEWRGNTNRMSYQDQINEWKYLIDIEGCGYSGRLKILMSSPRIVFFVDRPYQEWFFEYMEPWVHYVPVKRDLSDIHENYLKIESSVELQKYIKNNQKIFANKYLTRAAAEERVHEIIKEMIEYKKKWPTPPPQHFDYKVWFEHHEK